VATSTSSGSADCSDANPQSRRDNCRGGFLFPLQAWPELDAKYQVSNGGGTEPIWAADGRKLFYRRRDEVVEIIVATRAGVVEAGTPRVLFAGSFATDRSGDQSYDLGPK
jgi:hypothetical protein